MSEKRFIIVKSIENLYAIVDKERADKEQILILSLHKEQVGVVCDLLNEQESLIIKQDEEIKKLKRTERSWRKIHCCNKESDNCGIVIEQQAIIEHLKKRIKLISDELYCKDRKLEELGVSIECCDKDE